MKRGNRKHATKEPDVLISQSDFGQLVGRGRAWICRLCKRGILSLDKSGKLFREAALAQYAAFIAGGGTGPQNAPVGPASLEGVYRELAETRLAFAKLKITNQTLANRIAEIRAEIQRGKYAEVEVLKRTAAFAIAPLRAQILSLVARVTWLLAPSEARSIEVQELMETGLRMIYLRDEMRDLLTEKREMTAKADAVLSTCQDEGARALATRVGEIYSHIEPELLEKLNINTVGLEGNLAAVEDPARFNKVLDGRIMLLRDHDQPDPAPIVIRTLAGDSVTLKFDSEHDIQEIIPALTGTAAENNHRSPVIAEIEIKEVRFSSRLGDPIPPYSERMKAKKCE